mgnify:CR=1 FL=1
MKRMLTTAEKIEKECEAIKNLLLEKNKKYGDSAFNSGIMFEIPPLTAIKARINDKISRIKTDENENTEDASLDLIGYLILYRIAKNNVEG